MQATSEIGICDEKFKSLLDDVDPRILQSEDQLVYGCWSDFRLAYFNPGYLKTAQAVPGSDRLTSQYGLEASLLDAIQGPMRDFYAVHLLRAAIDGLPWEHLYECPTATAHRRFHMRAQPIGNSRGLLLTHSLKVSSKMAGLDSGDFMPEHYRNPSKEVEQCGNCRRVRYVPAATDRWDWVVSWVIEPPQPARFTLCPQCQPDYLPAPPP